MGYDYGHSLHTLPKFNSSPLKSYLDPIGKDRLPTTIFQGRTKDRLTMPGTCWLKWDPPRSNINCFYFEAFGIQGLHEVRRIAEVLCNFCSIYIRYIHIHIKNQGWAGSLSKSYEVLWCSPVDFGESNVGSAVEVNGKKCQWKRWGLYKEIEADLLSLAQL